MNIKDLFRKTLPLVAFCASLGAWATQGPVDGELVYNDEDGTWTSKGRWWLYDKCPSGGGVATIHAAIGGRSINQTTLDELLLGGISLSRTISPNFGGTRPITFTNAPYITGPGGTVTFTNVPLKVASGETLSVKMGPMADMYASVVDLRKTCFSGPGAVSIEGGYVKQSGTQDTCVSRGPVRFDGGAACVNATPSPEDVVTEMGTQGGVTIGPAGGLVLTTHNPEQSVTMALGPLSREKGGVLTFYADGDQLGEKERFVFKDATGLSGLMPAYLVSLGSDRKIDFFSYDAQKGLVPAVYATSLDAAGTQPVMLNTGGTVNNQDASMAALRVDLGENVYWTNNATFKIGNGTDPAGLIINWKGASAITGTGTLDFGASEAVIHLGSCEAKGGVWRILNLEQTIKTTGGISFAGRQKTLMPLVAYSGGTEWSGPLNIANCRFWLQRVENIPSGVDIYVNGSPSTRSGQFYIACGGTLPNDIFISGSGLGSESDAFGAINAAGGYPRNISGTVTLMDDAVMYTAKETELHLKGKITGKGDLVLRADNDTGPFMFYGTNDWQGALKVFAPVNVYVTHGGVKLGKGTIDCQQGATIDLSAADGFVLTNALTGAGTLALPLRADFSNDVSVATVRDAARSTVAVNRLTADSFAAKVGTRVLGAAPQSSVTLGGEQDETFQGKMEDGAGVLSFTKKGAGTLTLCGSQNYSGTTCVAAGTLKLESTPLPVDAGLSWWIDADDSASIELAADGQTVVSWKSRLGDVAFASAGTIPSSANLPEAYKDLQGKPWGLPKYETCSWAPGRKVVRFYAETFDRLYADSTSVKPKHRTLFFVVRMIDAVSMAGLFGHAGVDYGMRVSSYNIAQGWGRWQIGQPDQVNYFFNDQSRFQIDGTDVRSSNNQFVWSRPQIICVTRQADDDSSSYISFRPALGGYFGVHATAPFRPFGGEYAEVIAYDRVLSGEECQRVEDYLARKWYARDFYGTSVHEPAVLPAASALVIQTGGVLDLNGVSTTVASLDGIGRIVNSGAPATLTVAGPNTFSGTVGEKVTLVCAGGGQTALRMEGDGALKAQGALAVEPYVPRPAQDGLVYWLDASRPETMTFAADGVSVTNWASRAPAYVSFVAEKNASLQRLPPRYTRDGMNGKPALYFGQNDEKSVLVSEQTARIRTLFLVARGSGACQTSVDGIWGRYNNDTGIRFRNNACTRVQIYGGGSYFQFGDTVRMNGTDAPLTAQALDVDNGQPFVFAGIYGAWHGDAPNMTHALGGYYFTHANGPRAMSGWIAEVVAYARELTATELLETERYLRQKWCTPGALQPENTQIFAGSGDVTLVARVTAAGEVVPAAWTGPLDLSRVNLVVENADGLKQASGRKAVLTVAGEVTGDAFKTCLPQDAKWHWTRQGTTWSLSYASGMTLWLR